MYKEMTGNNLKGETETLQTTNHIKETGFILHLLVPSDRCVHVGFICHLRFGLGVSGRDGERACVGVNRNRASSLLHP